MKGYRSILVLGVLGAALVSGGALMRRGLVAAPAAANGSRLFEQVARLVQEKYIDSVGSAKLYRAAVDGMLRELGDPHTAYLAPQRLVRLTESTTGNYGGLGIEVDAREEGITVVAPLAGGPAEAAGIVTGDRITTVEGASTRGCTVDEASRALRGTPGTKISITVERPGIEEPLRFTLTRREVHRRAIRRSVMLQNEIGYVDVDIFSESTADELERAVEQLRGRGATKLVLDLRHNPGGLLEQGVAVTDLFLDSAQKVVEMRGRVPQSNVNFHDRAPQRWKAMPVLVLVDEASASASEIVAGALQDHDRAAIIGRTTFGKGSAQNLVPLPSGGALKVTTALWYTPSGRSINRTPGEAAPGADGDLLEPIAEGRERPEFRTAGGRVVYGGGGIAPDVLLPGPIVAQEEIDFARALGAQAPRFRDALTDYGLSLKASRAVTSPDFAVTDAMIEELWRRMERRDITMDRAEYDRGRATVTRLLANEISRYVFGPDAEFLRSSRDDEAIRIAIELATGARDQSDVLKRAEARAKRASAADSVTASRR